MEMGETNIMILTKQKILNFIFLYCAVCFSVVEARAADCGAGKYSYLYKQCYDCPPGCYCEGVKGAPWHGHVYGTVEGWCKDRASDTGYMNSLGLKLCDINFPMSAKNSKSSKDCYVTINGNRVYNKSITLEKGKYLPVNSSDQVPCGSLEDSTHYCPGGKTVKPSFKKSQGIEECTGGQVVNASKTGCETKCAAGEELKDGKCVSIKIHCIAGTYLPANSESCAACPSGKICLGGDFDKQPIDQGDDGTCDGNNIINSKGSGCTLCPTGTAPNENHTACSETAIHVEPGYYLRPNSAEPTSCANAGARKYCPGGDYKKGPSAAGIFDCPFNGTSENHITCNVSIGEEQMQYGPAGKDAPLESQCWLRTDPDDYRTCIFGTRFDVSKDK